MTTSTARATAVALLTIAGIASASAQQPPPQSPNMTFFLTGAGPGKGGDLGGLDGADAYCQRLGAAAGAGAKTWRAYLSSSTTPQGAATHARDRIGSGPWQNFRGVVIATSVDDLHSDNNKINRETSISERGLMIPGSGMVPNYHDILTGSDMQGRALPNNLNLTCNNWTSSTFGSAMVGHNDRLSQPNIFSRSWNAAHMSRSCAPQDLNATGGNGLFYCFAQ